MVHTIHGVGESVPRVDPVPDPPPPLDLNVTVQGLAAMVEQLQRQNEQLFAQNQALHVHVASLAATQQAQPTPPPILEPAEALSPFVDAIVGAAIPDNFKQPKMEPYDGTTDPHVHLTLFRTRAAICGANDALLCKAFLGSLGEIPLMWFTGLQARSVANFDDLARKFLTQFSSSKSFKKRSVVLFNIIQQPQESLKEYLSRFNASSFHISNLHPEVCQNAFENGLRAGPFSAALAQSPASSMDEVRARAEGFINAEETNAAKRLREKGMAESSPQPRKNPPNVRYSNRDPPSGGAGVVPDTRKRPWGRIGLDECTPLNTPRSQILKDVYNSQMLSFPPAPKPPHPGVNTSKWCDFHRSIGHNTDECWTLIEQIEDLIRRGFLQKYVVSRDNRGTGRGREQTRPQGGYMNNRGQNPTSMINQPERINKADKPNEPQRNTRGTIFTIAGGFVGGGTTSSARRRYARSVVNMVVTRQDREGQKKPTPALIFSDEDLKGIESHEADPMVVSVGLCGYEVRRVLVYQGSSADIMYLSVFQKLGLSESSLRPFEGALVGFAGDQVEVRGYIELETTFGTSPDLRIIKVKYLVISAPSSYNLLIGRAGLNEFQAVVSTYHLVMKFPLEGNRVGVVRADQKTARRCYNDSLKTSRVYGKKEEQNLCEMADFDPRDEYFDRRPKPTEDLKEVQIGESPHQCTQVGTQIDKEEEELLISLLKKNADLFAWTPADMPGIDPDFLCHHLAMIPSAKPVCQRKRKVGPDRRIIIAEEAAKLLSANFIREVQYTEWLANIVLVKKSSGKWRMCVDFTDLNKVCPKDPYPLPNIDSLVDGASGYDMISFMDAYSGYNQIRMHPKDEDKTSFMTERANYCYRVMPFGLENAGATYQRLMDRVFANQLGRNMEVYVDDMVVKSKKSTDHMVDLEETLKQLRKYNMRLNPEKCAFGVRSGKFLGFMLTQRGIEANPDQCQAIINMRSPANVREVQQLTGRMAALSRFLSCSADKAGPFFHLLRKNDCFRWTEECEEAFSQLKIFLATPPILVRPDPGEPLFLYLLVKDKAISSVMVIEKGKEQKPVYFVSRVLQDTETRYQKVEKVALALVITTQKLRHYFQCHKVIVRTDQPLRALLQKPDVAGRLLKWAVELSEFGIEFEVRGAIKAQALADFLVELTSPVEDVKKSWLLYVDGASNLKGSGAGIVLEGPAGLVVEESLRFGFKASNNQAEYEALIAGIKLALELGAKEITIHSDSQLITSQVKGDYQAKDPLLIRYLQKVKSLAEKFQGFEISFVPRERNVRADLLSKLASTKKSGNNQTVIQETLVVPSVDVEEVLVIREEEDGWMTPLLTYLKQGRLPEAEREADKLKRSATQFCIIGDCLYKRGFTMPLLKCLTLEQARYVMEEIHEGSCGSHIGGRSLSAKILCAGYYWPTIRGDCMTFVKKCDKCQRFSDLHKAPPEVLHNFSPSWPFCTWGVDILGPFPPAVRQLKFLIVAIDHFTKWIEAEPVSLITAERVKQFYWQRLICRFGIPREIISDNGRQFSSKSLLNFCKDLGIKLRFSSVEHPQTNGQVEAANKVIAAGLKKRLGEAKGRWAELLPQILLSYHTTPQSSTQESPFRLAYGTEAMIPVELSEPSPRVSHFHEVGNVEGRRNDLDLLQELREQAYIKACAAKMLAARKYNSKVRPRSFHEGDLVLRRASRAEGQGKLAPNWEGPYRVTRDIGKGAYQLEELQGKPIPRTWNASNLRFYYS